MVDITSNVIKDKSSNDSMTTDISRNESEKVDSKVIIVNSKRMSYYGIIGTSH